MTPKEAEKLLFSLSDYHERGVTKVRDLTLEQVSHLIDVIQNLSSELELERRAKQEIGECNRDLNSSIIELEKEVEKLKEGRERRY